jgi:hypothetical protein
MTNQIILKEQLKISGPGVEFGCIFFILIMIMIFFWSCTWLKNLSKHYIMIMFNYASISTNSLQKIDIYKLKL